MHPKAQISPFRRIVQRKLRPLYVLPVMASIHALLALPAVLSAQEAAAPKPPEATTLEMPPAVAGSADLGIAPEAGGAGPAEPPSVLTDPLADLVRDPLDHPAGHEEPPTAPQPNSVLESRVLALPPLMESGDLQFRGRFARTDLSIPLEAGARLQTATLKLAYQSTASLLSESSRLLVSMDGEALAELPLSPRRGQTRAEITLPIEDMHPEGSVLTLSVWQEHRQGCSLELSRDLWTQIDPTNSYLALKVERSDSDLLLGDLGQPNWPLGRTGSAIQVITPEPIERDLLFRIGGLVVQGLALRISDGPLIIDHVNAAPDVEEGGDVLSAIIQPIDLPSGNPVLIGTFDQLVPTLGAEIASRIDGPYVGVHRLAGGQTAGVLVVSGLSEEDVLFAATAFANPALELPAASSLAIEEQPPLNPAPIRFAQPGRTQSLEGWAAPKSMQHAGDQRMSFVLMLPPDFYVADNRKAELSVNYAYKPNVGPGSALHVIVNDEYAGLINLEDSAEGGMVDGQSVRLPLRLFRPGRNVLAFEPALTNIDAVSCSQLIDEGPSVGVFGDSTLRLPTVANVVQLPDLGLFASLGFPYGANAGEVPTRLVATSYDPSTISAAWTLVARLAQTAGAPLLGFDLAFGPKDDLAHILYVGPLPTLERSIAANTPLHHIHLRRDELSSFMPMSRGEDTVRGPVQSWLPPEDQGLHAISTAHAATWPIASERAEWERRIGRPVTRPDGPFGRIAVALDELLGDAARSVSTVMPEAWQPNLLTSEPGFVGDQSKQFDGAIAAIALPFVPARTATVVTAADSRMLERAVAALVQPATWHALRGDVAAWTLERPGAAAAQVSASFPMHEPRSEFRQVVLYWNSYLAEHPALWMMLVIFGLVTFALITRLSLSRIAGKAQ